MRNLQRGKLKKMKLVKQLMFTIVLAAGLSVSAMAQKDDQKKPPPKGGNTPVINPREKPPKDPPKDDKKPKKPGMAFAVKPGQIFVVRV
jgi:hypothetical protein